MVGTAFKNFCKNIIFVFVPMGILYLFVLVAIFALIQAFMQSTGDMLVKLTDLVSSTVESSQISVTDFFAFAAEELEGSGDFFHTLKYILDTDWVQRTVQRFFEMLGESSDTFSGQFTEIVTDFSGTLKMAVGIAISWVVLGIMLSNFATRFVLRRKTARRGIKKWIVANTLIPVVEALVMAGTVLLAAIVRYYTLLVLIVLLAAGGYLALLSSWLIHGKGKVPYKQVVSGKHIAEQLLSVVVMAVIVLALFFAVFFIQPLVALLVIVPVAVYAVNIVSVNCDSFVCNLVAATESGKTEKPQNDENADGSAKNEA